MRIGITCYPTYGGSGAVATELGLELGRRGHEVHIISYASPFRLRGGFAQRVTFHEVVPTDYPLFEHSPYALALAVKQHEVALREELQLLHAHYAIPHAATAWPVKRIADVIKVFAGVRRVLPATLVLAGDGPERDLAEQEVDRLKLRGDVRFLGKVDQVAELLRGGDLFLLPSASESFGLSALEAMACGVPVVATRQGGLPEVVVDGETGYLAAVGAVDEMTERALAVLQDGATHERMRRAAAARALEFSTERVVPRYEALYQDVLAGRAG